MAKRLSPFKLRQLWWRKTTRNHIERLKKVGKWHGMPRLTLREWQERWDQFDHRCSYCLKQFEDIRDVWIEHLVGIKEGGEHRIHNCVPACPKCNQTKGDKGLVEFCGIEPDQFIDHTRKRIETLKEQKEVTNE